MFSVYDHFIRKSNNDKDLCATCATFSDFAVYTCKHCGETSRPMNSCGSYYIGMPSPDDVIKQELRDHLSVCIPYIAQIRDFKSGCNSVAEG